MEEEVKKRKGKIEGELRKKEEGVVYRIEYQDYEKVYIGETQFTLEKIKKQHMKNNSYNNVTSKHNA